MDINNQKNGREHDGYQQFKLWRLEKIQHGKHLNIKLSKIIAMRFSRQLTTIDSVRRHRNPINFEPLI